jgi:alkylated DNA repair protein (DNA oxidative demethylase)
MAMSEIRQIAPRRDARLVVMSQQQFQFAHEPPGAIEVVPGATWLPGWLNLNGQKELLDACREWAKPPAGMRRPHMPNGAPFSTMAVCLGWHWYPYRYSRTCDDGDGAPVKPFPDLLDRLGATACRASDWTPVAYDAAIINFYDHKAKLGLHQDKIEGREVIAAGSPVVTISLGDTCTFRFGNVHRPTRPYRDLPLASGDLLVFGGPARLAFHGVPRIHPGTGPPGLALNGRISVTIRQSGQT